MSTSFFQKFLWIKEEINFGKNEHKNSIVCEFGRVDVQNGTFTG